jgi:glutathione S-transferase
MKLYSGPLSMFGAKAEIAAHEKGIAFELVMVPFEMATLYSPKHPEVLRINPKRQVPVLVDDDAGGDLEIFDSRCGRPSPRPGRAPACSSTSRTRSISRRSSV